MSVSVLLAASVAGQVGTPAVFNPAAPTDQDRIHATFSVPGLCSNQVSTIVDGVTVRTTVTLYGCVFGPPPFPQNAQAHFGPLPPGAYTYEIYWLFTDEPSEPPILSSRPPLVVAASIPGVPTLLHSSMIVLVGLLAGAGILTIGKAALR